MELSASQSFNRVPQAFRTFGALGFYCLFILRIFILCFFFRFFRLRILFFQTPFNQTRIVKEAQALLKTT